MPARWVAWALVKWLVLILHLSHVASYETFTSLDPIRSKFLQAPARGEISRQEPTGRSRDFRNLLTFHKWDVFTNRSS